MGERTSLSMQNVLFSKLWLTTLSTVTILLWVARCILISTMIVFLSLKSTPTQFQTIIFASTENSNVGDSDGDMSETKLSERPRKILNLIKESPTISGRQMSEILSVSQRTIERDLSALQKFDMLKHKGKANDGTWVIL